MRKIGRNDPCPCGSGKKYKRCHGSATLAAEPEEKARPATKTQTTAAEPMGVPGQQQHIIVVNQFKDPNDTRNFGGPQGAPGKYSVTFILSRPGFNLLREGQHSFVSGLRGDSHLAI